MLVHIVGAQRHFYHFLTYELISIGISLPVTTVRHVRSYVVRLLTCAMAYRHERVIRACVGAAAAARHHVPLQYLTPCVCAATHTLNCQNSHLCITRV